MCQLTETHRRRLQPQDQVGPPVLSASVQHSRVGSPRSSCRASTFDECKSRSAISLVRPLPFGTCAPVPLEVQTRTLSPPFFRSSGKALALEVEPAEDVFDLMERIAMSEWMVPPDQQRLLLAGRPLDGGRSLADCGIHKAATIDLLLRLRGGTTYLCGDCGQTNEIKPKDPIRCRFCGYRILYKMRTKNCVLDHLTTIPPTLLTPTPFICLLSAVIQFEAR